MSEKTVNSLILKAYQLLAKREYSHHELLQRLLKLASKEVCEEAMRQLVSQGAQSDDRYAESLCRSRYGAGKGPVLIRYELRNQKINEELIEKVMEPYTNEWTVLAEQVRKKKFGEELPKEYSQLTKQLRFLQQRGFGQAELSQYSVSHF
ncbi:MAG: regulatory protein RecX [Gammaproteobacteria bacterium]|nr:regulatory protein RecX [Gammaproteobacteria bacterium]MCY4218302.1 regulatory protein RecX [Gammaproteobacteria bacterium]MCY4274311.1 regulatory protein RecX [Gammaproteobacteria bacterium]